MKSTPKVEHHLILGSINNDRIRAGTPAHNKIFLTVHTIANGIMWQRWLDEGRYRNINELAEAVGRDRAIVSHTLQLAMLSPEIVHMAIAGTLPPHISFKNFKAGLPADWTEQKRFLGLL